MCKRSDYMNKLFSVMGDSISTLQGYSVPENAVYYDTAHKLASGVLTAKDAWWGQVTDHFGGQLLINNSFSGSTVCCHTHYMIHSYACSDERTSSLHRSNILPDVIIIYMGTNDWCCGFRVFRDERYDPDKENPARFLSAYRQMLTKLKANYPEAEIWCCTLPISKCSAKTNFTFPYYYGGRNISEYSEAIRICAHEFGCREIDLYNKCAPYDTLDGFHPTAGGMRTIANTIIEEIEGK